MGAARVSTMGRATWRLVAVACVAVVALTAGGCASAVLAPKIVTAPNRAGGGPATLANDNPEARVALAQVFAQTWRVAVPGPPAAEIAVGVIEPGDYRQEHALVVQTEDPTRPKYAVHTRWDPLAADAPQVEPKGTVVVLHGFWLSREAVLHWAIHLAQAGYRTVPVDLRGHGRSTGDWVSYGAVEAEDLAAVLDDLQRRGLADGRVGVLGVSYGASVGLLWAARDPRVGAVVALEPFGDPRLAIRQYARAMLSPTVNRTLSDRAIAAAADKGARLAGFSWEQADVGAAVARLQVPVLFIHGAADTVIPPDHSRGLVARAPAGSRLIERPGDDHFSLSMRLDGVAAEVVAWLDAAWVDGVATPLR